MVAATAASQKMVHLHGLLLDMGVPQTLPLTLYVDNQACIAMGKNPIQHGKTKHFAVKLHFLRDLYLTTFLVLEYLSTDDMPADIFTKSLGKIKIIRFSKKIFGVLE